MSVGSAAELLHSVEGEKCFIGEALFIEEIDEARDGGGGHVRGVFEEVPEGFEGGGAGVEVGEFVARGLGEEEVEAGFDLVEELKDFEWAQVVGFVGVKVGRGAKEEGVVVELVVFEVEVVLTERGVVAKEVERSESFVKS